MAERKLLWGRQSEAHPERHNYNFLAINSSREIRAIKQKLYEQLKPVSEERTIGQGTVGRLRYILFSLQSPVSEIDFSKVYLGKVRKDRRLQPRRTLEGWEIFMERVASGEI